MSSENRLIKIETIIGDRKRGIPAMIEISRSNWYAGVKKGIFPQPIKIGTRSSFWLEQEIQDFITSSSTKNVK